MKLSGKSFNELGVGWIVIVPSQSLIESSKVEIYLYENVTGYHFKNHMIPYYNAASVLQMKHGSDVTAISICRFPPASPEESLNIIHL